MTNERDASGVRGEVVSEQRPKRPELWLAIWTTGDCIYSAGYSDRINAEAVLPKADPRFVHTLLLRVPPEDEAAIDWKDRYETLRAFVLSADECHRDGRDNKARNFVADAVIAIENFKTRDAGAA